MTWGALRHALGIAAPGLSPDLLDSFINERYGKYLDHYPWKGLEADAVLETVAGYTTGTVSVDAGSADVVGVDTTFTTEMTGRRIQIAGLAATYEVTYVSATELTLDRAFEGLEDAEDASFTIFQNVFTLPADVKTVLEIASPSTGKPLTLWSKAEMDGAVGGWRSTLADAHFYAMGVDTGEADPPVLHTVELYPCPILAKGYPMRYLKAAVAFDGETTNSAPLPFVSTAALLDGVRADIQTHLKNFNGADRYEAKWKEDVARQVRIDVARRGPKKITMPKTAEYRMRRVMR